MMKEERPTDRVTIQVFDSATGRIRQTVSCERRVAEMQHQAFPGHEHIDTTDHHEDVKHSTHKIDIATRKPVRRGPYLDEAKGATKRVVHHHHDMEELASGKEVELQSAAILGGEKERQALQDFVNARNVRREKRDALLERIEATTTAGDAVAVKWGGLNADKL